MVNRIFRAINVSRPLEVPDLSVDEQRIEDAQYARLLLPAPRKDVPDCVPSEYATSMIVRMARVAQIPGAITGPIGSPQAQAMVECSAMLGSYIRRLEDIARAHASCTNK